MDKKNNQKEDEPVDILANLYELFSYIVKQILIFFPKFMLVISAVFFLIIALLFLLFTGNPVLNLN